VTERKFIGRGLDFGQLTDAGVEQANAVSSDPRLSSAEFIVASPYTRALQTAAIISKNTGLEIKIETDLHEWSPDTTQQYSGSEYVDSSFAECMAFKGERSPDAKYNWESLSSVAKRAIECLYKYENSKKIIVIAHGMVMRQFVYAEYIPYCGILETDFDRDFKWGGFVEAP
jgi:broad specificity phosphatase PhoE